MRWPEIGMGLEIPSLQCSAYGFGNRLRRAIYTSSLLWKRRLPKCCFNGSNNKVNVPGVSSRGTATTVASDMRCLGVYCHVEVSHLETDHLFAPLRPNLDGRRFYSNEKVEMVIFEWLRLAKAVFYLDGMFNGC
jgi:hypothetical protein